MRRFVGSGDQIEAAKKARYKDTHPLRITFYLFSKYKCQKEVNGKNVNEYDHHVMGDGLKNGESSSVLDMSLYPEVLDSLRKRKIKHQIHSDHVFSADPKRAFRTALKRATIIDLLFHTIRHTTMSYLA